MRKHLRALAALSILGASVGVVGSGPTFAAGEDVEPTKGLIDVASSIESLPGTVSPPGETVLFKATITNVGALTVDGELTVDLVSGAFYRDALSSAACDASGSDAVCVAPALAPGATRTFDVLANTAPRAEVQRTFARAAVTSDIVEPFEYQQNNTSFADTTVLAVNSQYRAGLVEPGESMDLTLGDGRRYILTVPPGASENGVIVRKLAPQSGAGKACGAYACGEGFHLDFVQHPSFKAENPYKPLVTKKTFGPQPPCRGLGSDSCGTIYFAKSETAVLLTQMPTCGAVTGDQAGTGFAIPSPCINQRFKQDGLTWYDVRLLSNDPVELPPVLLG